MSYFLEDSGNRFKHQIRTGIMLGMLDDCYDWCRENLMHEWRIEQTEFNLRSPCMYNFYFESEQDAVTFSLKWKNHQS